MSPPELQVAPRRWLLLALGWAAAARAAYLFFYAADPLYGHLLHDAKRYHEWAMAWAQDRAWEAAPFYQAPLYPWLLSIVYRVAGPRPAAAYSLQLLGGCLLVFLVHRIAARIRGPRAGAIAAGLAALYGTFAFYETKLLPASIAALLAALLVDRLQVAEVSAGAVALLPAGIVLGLASLANPSSLLALPLATLWIALDRGRGGRERLRRASWLVVGSVVAILPVAARNFLSSGEIVPISTNGGITFFQGNNPGAEGVFAAPEGFSGSIFTQREESRAIAEKEAGRPLKDGEVSAFWFRKGMRFAAGDPTRWLALEGQKLLLSVASTELPLEVHPRLDDNPARFLAPVPFALVLALASLRLLAGRRVLRAEIPVFIVLGTVLATLLLFYVSSRYRLPALPALVALAGSSLAWCLESAQRSRRAAVFAACVFTLSLAYVPLARRDLLAVLDARGLADLAEAQLASGFQENAVTLYRRAVSMNPEDAYARLDLSKALRATGDAPGAERELREAVRIAPALSEARYDLGVLLFESGRLGPAAEEFRQAFRLDPSSVPAANNFLGTLLKLGRKDEAIHVHGEMTARGTPVDPPLAAWIHDLTSGNARPPASKSE